MLTRSQRGSSAAAAPAAAAAAKAMEEILDDSVVVFGDGGLERVLVFGGFGTLAGFL